MLSTFEGARISILQMKKEIKSRYINALREATEVYFKDVQENFECWVDDNQDDKKFTRRMTLSLGYLEKMIQHGTVEGIKEAEKVEVKND